MQVEIVGLEMRLSSFDLHNFSKNPNNSAIRRDDGCAKLQVQILGADNRVLCSWLLSKDPQAESPWKLNLCHS